jgi:hypothetical protein
MTRLFLAIAVVVLLTGLTGCSRAKDNNPKPAAGTRPDPRLQPAVRPGVAGASQQAMPQGAVNVP